MRDYDPRQELTSEEEAEMWLAFEEWLEKTGQNDELVPPPETIIEEEEVPF